MKKLFLALTVLLVTAPIAQSQDLYTGKGFSINALIPKNISNSQPVLMSLPVSEGFAPNVNVQVQSYPGDLKAYFDLSIDQIKKMNLSVLNKKITKQKVEFEYAGLMQGLELHFFATAYKKDQLIYLATATSLKSQWKQYSSILKSCVGSLELSN